MIVTTLRAIRGVRVKYVAGLGFLIIIFNYFGVFIHPFERDYYTEFSYPLEDNVQKYVQQLETGRQPEVPPINEYQYPFLISSEKKCQTDGRPTPIRLLLVIKSAVKNFDKRGAIRNTWGWEKRFSDVQIRRVFMLGVVHPDDLVLEQQVMDEHDKYGDIVQSSFVDTYWNNTIKTMMGFRWVVEFCESAQFVMFVDDDMYVSVKNLLKFIRHPQSYPQYYKQKTVSEFKDEPEQSPSSPLYAGFVFFSAPHRHKSSKWCISLVEYPFHMFPPYVTAGAFVLSQNTLRKFYYTSKYTKHFRFDDVYLGLVSAKAGVTPLHNDQFHFWKSEYSRHGYRHLIASHGFDSVKELQDVWTEQRSSGYA